jgi:hypothetical protein
MRIDTTTTSRPPRAAKALGLTRSQLALVAVLACVPLPLLSLGAIVVPLPEVVERGAASFAPFGVGGATPARADRRSSGKAAPAKGKARAPRRSSRAYVASTRPVETRLRARTTARREAVVTSSSAAVAEERPPETPSPTGAEPAAATPPAAATDAPAPAPTPAPTRAERRKGKPGSPPGRSDEGNGSSGKANGQDQGGNDPYDAGKGVDKGAAEEPVAETTPPPVETDEPRPDRGNGNRGGSGKP